ncbi:MAG TPA: efflux RND transporter periplasmic adaptor subunit, partial [Schlesneria sp.]
KDWSALKLSPGQKILVQTPALPDTTLESTIAFIGRTVNQETRATPVVADISNEDRLLKPGMFVRVLLPDGPAVEAMAVPESAVVRSEGRTYVFVATSAHEFTPRDVTLGITVEPWIEVKSGLAAGDQIAISGTFLLKSEMLLEPEE